MSYQTELEKTEQPLSAELYKIKIGSDIQYFTSYSESITCLGLEYLPRPFKRTGFSIEKTMKTIDVTVSSPVSVAFQEYLSTAPYAQSTVQIYKVFVSNPDSLIKLLFSGIVYNVSVKKCIASALCKSSNGLLSRKVPRLFYQTNCNYALYSVGCGVSKVDYEFPAIVNTVYETTITIDNLNTVSTNKFEGGTITFDQEQRLIIEHDNTTITLLIPFSGLVAGSVVSLYPGCNGSSSSCAAYGNEDRFMGMPFIPTKNALLWGFR